MKNIGKYRIFVFLLLAVALCGGVYAENITYVYTTASGNVISQNTTNNLAEVNVTLPNTTWNLELRNNASRFSVLFESINASIAPRLDIAAWPVNLSDQNYDGVLGNTNSFDYVALYGFVFNLSQLRDYDYNLTLNYSGLSMVKPLAYKCELNISVNITNTSDCTLLNTIQDTTRGVLTVNSSGFSSFFIAEDHCNNGVSDYGETGTDCGGSCADCSSGTGSGSPSGGGGGGGGGSSGSSTIYVTPTLEGVSVNVYKNSELIIQYEGNEYTFRITNLKTGLVTLKSLATYMLYDVGVGEEKIIGLKSILDRDIGVSMYVTNNYAVLTIRKIGQEKPSFSLLSPRGRDTQPEEDSDEDLQEPIHYTPPASLTAQATKEAPAPVEVPSSPLSIWTILISLVFVIFLVGGIALYRTRSLFTGKPPTVTKSGFGSEIASNSTLSSETGFLQSAQAGVRGVSDSQPKTMQRTTGGIQASGGALVTAAGGIAQQSAGTTPQTTPTATTIEKPVVHHDIPREKKLELEKYVFHVYSLGFGESQVKEALLAKGWPADVIDDVLADIRRKVSM